MTSRRAWIRRALVIVIAGVGAEQLWRHGHDYVFPSKFVVVEPGKIFGVPGKSHGRSVISSGITRSRRSSPWLTHLIIISRFEERKLAAELGVNWIHIPIVDNRGTNDRAAEDAISDLLDQAAGVLADPKNYPVFFHCHHGLNRTSMVQIAYRTKYCGWTLAQAADEIERSVGLVKVNHGPDYRHMVSFYENRVLPLRGQHSNVTAKARPT